jgi:biopolymer transport protein ExbD
MHNPGEGAGEAAEPNLVPLLDLVFQLIMFFMITVNFVRLDQINEEVVLPPAQQAVPMDKAADNWVFLNMNKDGKLLVSTGESLDTPSKLKAYVERQRRTLESEARERGHVGEFKVVIVLRAHQDARYKEVWEALDACNKAGYHRWQLRVRYVQKQA